MNDAWVYDVWYWISVVGCIIGSLVLVTLEMYYQKEKQHTSNRDAWATLIWFGCLLTISFVPTINSILLVCSLIVAVILMTVSKFKTIMG